jgi:hypothetical protein
MPKGNVRFKQSDVARAIRAVMQTGAPFGVEITPEGTIRLVPATNVAKVDKKAPRPKTLF